MTFIINYDNFDVKSAQITMKILIKILSRNDRMLHMRLNKSMHVTDLIKLNCNQERTVQDVRLRNTHFSPQKFNFIRILNIYFLI